MKHHALFSSKDTSKKKYCRLLQFSLGALRVRLILKTLSYLELFVSLSICLFTYPFAVGPRSVIGRAPDS